MKQSSAIISAIVAAGVLLAALAVGLYIRDKGQRSISAQSESADKSQTKQADIITKNIQKVEDEQRSRNLSPEQEAQLKEQIQIIKQQWVNMSEQEKKEFRAKLLETFDDRQQNAESEVQTSPTEGRDRFGEEFLEIKNQWEDMTEEERQAFMEKMRENANDIGQGND
jgi:hypothetical protein